MKPAEAYILKQNEPYKTLLLELQSIITCAAPKAELLYKWRLPFFYNNTLPLCYLNQSKNYVDFAFWHYSSMDKYQQYFVDTNRKHVRSFRYFKPEDIVADRIMYVINTQLEINTNPFHFFHKK